MTQIPIQTARFRGLPLNILKSREIFKLQISLDEDKKLLVYNCDKSKCTELAGGEAKDICEFFKLDRFTKPKTYVYGSAPGASISLEADGEVPFIPNW